MLRAAFQDTAALRTYASYANAEVAFRKAAAKIGVADMTYIVAATPEGRFYPVALPCGAQVQDAISLVHTNTVCFFRN